MAACRRSCSLEVDSFALTFKFSEAPQALRANFFARTGRFCARFARSKGHRTRFWKPKRLDFRGFSCITAARGKIAHTGGETLQKLTKSCSACASERPGSAPGRQLGVPHGQHGAQDGQHGAQDNPTWRPAAVPSASRRVPGGTRSDPRRPGAPPSNI